LKVNDENSRIRIQDPDPDLDPNPDPLVRGMDPRIRIRIYTKMSWIRNTGIGSDYSKDYLPFTIYDRSPRNVPMSQITLSNSFPYFPDISQVYIDFQKSVRNVNISDFREF
jgi:hypothetical protein